jgi:membrane-bound lytic murein transglycosylase C
MVDEYQKGVLKSLDEYEAFQKKWMEEFDAFKKEQTKIWGDFKERSKKDWVEYKDGGKTRTSVDFERGTGRVEVIAETPADVAKAKAEMAKKLAETFTAKPTEAGFEPKDKKLENRPVTQTPALENQIKTDGKPVEKVAEQMVQAEVKTKEVKGEDGKTRTVVYVDFNLAPNHLKVRAEKVQQFVYEHAKKYNMDPALVFAIIHTESYYNPTAKSPANAHGLMQLVPTSGGRDAYTVAFSKDGIPTPEFLYDPSNNVLLGATYVDILRKRYFKDVNNPATRDYLAICAYNTGAGNVAKAYTGTTSPKAALPEINRRSEKENYDHLVANLPYAETRDYLKKVAERREMYSKWMKNNTAEVK